MGGGSIKKPTQKRSINFTTETLETLDKLAAKNHTTTSELVRGYVEKGLSIEGSREDIDFIARIIRQEITAVYHVDEIKAIADHDTDRLAKMLMKIGKINGAIFFLLIKVLMNLANEGSEDDFRSGQAGRGLYAKKRFPNQQFPTGYIESAGTG